MSLMLGAAAILTACLGLCACESMNPPARTDPPAHRADQDSVALQAALFGYADTYIALTRQGADALMATDRTPQRRVRAIHAKLDGAQDVIEIVTGPNPTTALLDLAVMVTIQRRVWDEYWVKTVFTDGSGKDYSDAMERLEREVWRIVDETIPASEAASLRTLAQDIRRQYRDEVYVTGIRASKIALHADRDAQGRGGGGPPQSLLALFGLDPLADLSPAVAEVTKTRLLAERMFYYSQKVPSLLGWRGELLLSAAMTFPESERTLENADEVVASLKRFATLAEDLPAVIAKNRAETIVEAGRVLSAEVLRVEQTIATERTALLKGVADERVALLEAFDERHAEAQAVLAELKGTIQAADALSVSVKGVLVEVKALSGDKAGSSEAPPGRPFDIREYQQAIESATGTLRELNTAVHSARELVDSPQWRERERTIRSLTQDVRVVAVRLIVYASIGLALALFAGMSGAFAVRRWLAQGRAVRDSTPVTRAAQ